MTQREDGGPAFPTDGFKYSVEHGDHQTGMSLRDYFAAKAMAARILTMGGHFHGSDEERRACKAETAQRAYEMADAMLAARMSDAELAQQVQS